MNRLTNVYKLTDQELEDMLENLGFGDNPNLPYYGYNFNIIYKEDGAH